MQYTYSVDEIAEACHTMNRAYCRVRLDFDNVPWHAASPAHRESVFEGVKNILNGTVTTPEQSHESWLARKETEGWKYGPVKDAGLKVHPCMVSFDRLPATQMAKDTIFFAVVSGMRGEL